jgi:hypothetical protein
VHTSESENKAMSNTLFFKIGANKSMQTYAIEDPLENWYLDVGVPRCSACQKVVHFGWDSPLSDGAVAMCGCNRDTAEDWSTVRAMEPTYEKHEQKD